MGGTKFCDEQAAHYVKWVEEQERQKKLVTSFVSSCGAESIAKINNVMKYNAAMGFDHTDLKLSKGDIGRYWRRYCSDELPIPYKEYCAHIKTYYESRGFSIGIDKEIYYINVCLGLPSSDVSELAKCLRSVRESWAIEHDKRTLDIVSKIKWRIEWKLIKAAKCGVKDYKITKRYIERTFNKIKNNSIDWDMTYKYTHNNPPINAIYHELAVQFSIDFPGCTTLGDDNIILVSGWAPKTPQT